MFMMYFIHTKFSPTRFDRYCCHLQGDIIITRIQRDKCG